MNENEETKSKIIIGIVLAIVILVVIVLLCLKGCVKEYTVSFDSAGGSAVSSIKVKENESITEPSEPTRDGYIFGGWYYNEELFDFDTKIKENLTLSAKWNKEEDGKLVLENTSLELKVDGNGEIKILSYPENLTLEDLIFTSSDESIVKVSNDGKLIAYKDGNATITIKSKDGKYEEKVVVTVTKKIEEEKKEENTKPSNNGEGSSTTKPSTSSKPKEVAVTSVTISGGSSVNVGGTLQLSANVSPSNATNKSVTWSIVSGSDKATIDQKGKLTAKASGKVTVKVTSKNGKTATKEITISSVYKVVLIPECSEMPGVPPLRYQFFVYRDGKIFKDYVQFIYNGVEATPRSYTIPSKNVSSSVKSVKISLSNETVNATVTYQANNNC